MLNLAHRGYSDLYPENTMKAFQEAYVKGFDGVETDVHLTKDGQLVLIHDERINRTSNGKGYVKDMTLEELRQYSYAYKFNGHHDIPTLRDLLEFIKGKDFVVNIELKTDVIHYQNIEKMVLDLVKELDVENQVYYSSFYLPSVLKVKELCPDAYAGYLMEYHYKRKKEELFQHPELAFHPKHTFLTKKRVEVLKNQGVKIASWTIPSRREFMRLKNLGVDILISNKYFLTDEK